MTLHTPHIHELPIANRFIRVSHPDGTVWAIPVSAVLDQACRYYEANGWDDETEDDFSGVQPTGDELRGIVEVNADFEQEARECRWSRIEDAAQQPLR